MLIVGIQAYGLTSLSACDSLVLFHTPGPNALPLKLREHSEAVGIQCRFTRSIPCFPHTRDRAIVLWRLCPDREGRYEPLVVVHSVDTALFHRFAHQIQWIRWVPMTKPQPHLHILPAPSQDLVQGFNFVGAHFSSM